MANFEKIMTLSLIISSIKEQSKELSLIFQMVLLSTLEYENKKEEKKVKNQFYKSVKEQVEILNEKITAFNQVNNWCFKYANFEKIERIKITTLKTIIQNHKGDYKQKEKFGTLSKLIDHQLGKDDSASSLSRKNTLLLLNQTLQVVREGMNDFIKKTKSIARPFVKSKYENKLKKIIIDEINKARDCYSVGLIGESVFIMGKTVELVAKRFLLHLKKNKKIELTTKTIQTWDFETKINFLKSKKAISPSQHSKIMSVKWDRNIFGHPSTRSEIKHAKEDAEATIRIALSIIDRLEQKIN